MKNPNIAKTLRYYRKSNKLSVAQVAEKLDEISPVSVAQKTIYGWEGGQTQPDADMLLRLCKLYKIHDILEAFGYSEQEDTLLLSATEKELIQHYRQRPDLQTPINMLLNVTTPAIETPKTSKKQQPPSDRSSAQASGKACAQHSSAHGNATQKGKNK